MEIHLDQITNYYPWNIFPENKRLIPNTRVLKELSHPTQIEKLRHQVRNLEIKENKPAIEYSDDELKKIFIDHIKRFFEVEEDSESLTLLKETQEYLDLIDNKPN